MPHRQHYSVTATVPESEERRFHSYAEADERFAELSRAATSEGRELVSESYWRRSYRAEGGPTQEIALDARGLGDCDNRCGGA